MAVSGLNFWQNCLKLFACKFSPDSHLEIDFVIQNEDDEIIPIEVKAEENLKAKSLKTYCDKYKNERAIRTSLSDYRQESWMTNVPLYVIGDYL